MAKKKRTHEDEENERAFINSTSLQIVRDIEAHGSLRAANLRLVHSVMVVVGQRERIDQCYYCARNKTEVELGTERDTGLTMCYDCAGRPYDDQKRTTFIDIH